MMAAQRQRIEVAILAELPAGSRKLVRAGGKEIGLFNEGGRISAVLNLCPHWGAPVCQGTLTGLTTVDTSGKLTHDATKPILRCPWHRWEFDLYTGKAIAPISERLRTYPVEIEGEKVYIIL